MTKPRLAPDEHEELGRVLAGISDELQHRSIQLANAYPRSGPEAVPGKALEAAVRAIDDARHALEDALYQEHPLSAETSVYFPPSEDRARIERRWQ